MVLVVDPVVLLIFVAPVTSRVPPMLVAPPIPTPPATTKAPLATSPDAVTEVIEVSPVTSRVVSNVTA